MMDSAEDLRRRIRGTKELGSVVRTMKALAAASVRQTETAVASLADYTRTVERAMHVVALNLPPDISKADLNAGGVRDGRCGGIVFGSDQGMCGPFNDQIAAFAANDLAERCRSADQARVWAVGERLIPVLDQPGLAVDRLFGAPGSIEGFGAKVSELLADLETWRSGHDLSHIYLYYHRPAGPAATRPQLVPFWPVELSWLADLRDQPWRSRTLPMLGLDWEEMLRHIARQYLYIELYRALADSVASENGSRLLTMERAEQNIEESLEELATEYNYVRQQAITVELLDIVSGFEALAGEKEQTRRARRA